MDALDYRNHYGYYPGDGGRGGLHPGSAWPKWEPDSHSYDYTDANPDQDAIVDTDSPVNHDDPAHFVIAYRADVYALANEYRDTVN